MRASYNLLVAKSRGFATKPAALKWLGVFAFIEAIFFPIPADVPLVAYGAFNRRNIWRAAAVVTLFSVLGGIVGYAVGVVAYEQFTSWLGLGGLAKVSSLYNEWGAWLVVVGGFTFLPYKTVTVTSGFLGLNLGVFILASLISRGARYYLVAAVMWFVPEFKRRHLELAMLAILLLAGLVLWQFG